MPFMVTWASAFLWESFSALHRNKLLDHVARMLSLGGVAMPSFWFGLILLIVFFYYLGIFPSSGRLGFIQSPPPHLTGFYTIDSLASGQLDVFKEALVHLVLPAFTLSIGPIAMLSKDLYAAMGVVLMMALIYSLSSLIVDLIYGILDRLTRRRQVAISPRNMEEEDRMDQPLELRPRRRMNVIWVFGDAHRAQALSHRGDPNVRTRNIDSLARRGVRFDAAVAGAPWCSPFRAALLTGLYPHQCGVVQIPQRLDPAIPTITEPFRQAGYHTAFVGKWHLDGFDEHTHYVPPERRGGFDYWMGYDNNNNQEECFVFGTGHETPRRLPGYESDSLTDLVLTHLEQHVTAAHAEGTYQPFFAVLSVQPPHSPMVPPTNPSYHSTVPHQSAIAFRPNVPAAAAFREATADANVGYYGMIENLDFNVGRILTALKTMGIDRETYVVFFSDHGDMLGSHGMSGNSLPWEECVRIPFIVGMVGGHFSMKVGTTDALVNHVDIAPTTLGLCGIDIPKRMEGYDYSRYCIKQDRPEYRGEPDLAGEPDSAFLQQIPRKFYCPVNRAWRGVVMRDGWKYVCTPHHDWLLYDTADDPYEQANLVYWRRFQGAKERCHERLVRWIAETDDAFELPDITIEGVAGCWPPESRS